MPGYFLSTSVPTGSAASWQDWGVMQGVCTLDILGKGTGASKTTTVIDGPVIAEEFGVGDAVFVSWGVPDYCDRTSDLRVRVHFYLATSEVGKLVSWRIQTGSSNGLPVNQVLYTASAADVPVAAQWLDAHADFILPATSIGLASADAINIKLERIASSNDPVGEPRVHLVQMTKA